MRLVKHFTLTAVLVLGLLFLGGCSGGGKSPAKNAYEQSGLVGTWGTQEDIQAGNAFTYKADGTWVSKWAKPYGNNAAGTWTVKRLGAGVLEIRDVETQRYQLLEDGAPFGERYGGRIQDKVVDASRARDKAQQEAQNGTAATWVDENGKTHTISWSSSMVERKAFEWPAAYVVISGDQAKWFDSLAAAKSGKSPVAQNQRVK